MSSSPTPAGPLFATVCLDDQHDNLRANTRSAHLQWATDPVTDVLLAGPLRADPAAPPLGSLLILRAASQSAAADVLAADPYAKAGLFCNVELRPWRCGMMSPRLPQQMFVVWCVDRTEPHMLQRRAETRPRHLEWWKSAGRKGVIGPFPCEGGACGTLIVCEGADVDEVRLWADTDPYAKAGLFERVDVWGVTNVVDRLSVP